MFGDADEKLFDAIPKDTPWISTRGPWMPYISTVNFCNLRCPICPVSAPNYRELVGPPVIMEKEMFERVVDDFCEGGAKSFMTCITGEPALDPNLAERIAYIKSHDVMCDLTTNAVNRLVEKHASGLVDCGLDYIRFSVYPPEFYQNREQFEAVFESIEAFAGVRGNRKKPYIHVKVIRDSDVAPVAKRVGRFVNAVNSEENIMYDWGGSKKYDSGADHSPKLCPIPWYRMAVLANGDCYPDALLPHPYSPKFGFLGNCKNRSVLEIWNGPEAQAFRKQQLSGRQNIPMCKACTHVNHQEHDLDGLMDLKSYVHA